MRLAWFFLCLAFSTYAGDIRIEWCRNAGESPEAIIEYEIWHSTDLINWELLIVTDFTSFQKPADLSQEFFKVRARYQETGEVSDWGTNEPCQ